MSLATGRPPTGIFPEPRPLGSNIDEATREMLLAVMTSEIEKQRRSAATLRMILQSLYGVMPNPISLNRIASSQNIPCKDRKYHFVDPAFLDAVRAAFRLRELDELSIVRGIGRGVLVTRSAFEFAAVPRIPLWAFLSLGF